MKEKIKQWIQRIYMKEEEEERKKYNSQEIKYKKIEKF